MNLYKKLFFAISLLFCKKEGIFEHSYGKILGWGSSLREGISLTCITIQETGKAGKGGQFERRIEKGVYRFRENHMKIGSESKT